VETISTCNLGQLNTNTYSIFSNFQHGRDRGGHMLLNHRIAHLSHWSIKQRMTQRRPLDPPRDFISGRGLLSRILTYTEVTRIEVVADSLFTNLLFFVTIRKSQRIGNLQSLVLDFLRRGQFYQLCKRVETSGKGLPS